MYFEEFKIKAERLYHKYFPKSKCFVECEYGFGGSSISIHCYLANSRKECMNNLWENDMFKSCIYFIQMPTLKGTKFEEDIEELPDILKGTTVTAPKITTAPHNDDYAYGYEYIRESQITGDAKKILNWLDNQFNKLYDTTIKIIDTDRVADDYIELVADKIR